MKTFRHLTVAIGAALLCAAGAAQASQNTTQLSYSNLQFQVIDLTPDDGIAAGFTVLQNTTSITLLTQTPYDVRTGQQIVSSGQGGPLTASLQYQNITLAGSTPGISSGSLTGTISDEDTVDSRGLGGLRNTVYFELAPNTALLLTGHLELTLGQSAGLPAGVGSLARGFVDMELYGMPQSTISHATATLGKNTWAHGTGLFEDDLSLVISNRSDVVRRGGTSIELGIDTRYYTAGVPAVPEPASYGMLVTGLAVAGLMARRRKQA